VLKRLASLSQPLMGERGFSGLLGRATVSAAGIQPSLVGLSTHPPLTPETLHRELGAILAAEEEPGRPAAALVCELLALLASILGWDTTLELMREAWPDQACDYEPARDAPLPRASALERPAAEE